MKRLLHIALALAAIWGAQAWATPDNGMQQSRLEALAAQPSVEGGVGRVVLTAGSVEGTFSIYSITGQLLKTVRVPADGHVTVDLPKGFYIVRYKNQWSRKVVVK